MRLTEVREFHNLGDTERALRALRFGAELARRPRRKLARGRLPSSVGRGDLGDAGPILQRLHRVPGVAARRVPGMRHRGRLKIHRTHVDDIVMTSPARKAQAARMLRRRPGEATESLAIRQLAMGMLDGAPVPRLCAAYAYWQATGAAHVAVPILSKSLTADDQDEFLVAAHCLRYVDATRLKDIVGTAEDDRAWRPRSRTGPGALGPVQESMTVIVHGTFATDHAWYQPGGDFHTYIRQRVYPDVYSGNDFFSWSGRWSHPARVAAATKLKRWCDAHPATTLRFLAHSHGANVVNLATQRGLQTCTLVHLSPSVHDRYLPDMTRVSSDRFFVIRPRIDLVVFIDGGRQTYEGTPVANFETQRIIAVIGHSESHDRQRWANRDVPATVRTVCA